MTGGEALHTAPSAARQHRRVLFLAHGLSAASCRFRMLQYLPHLREIGVHADVGDLNASARARRQLLRSAAAYDSVCIHRALFNPFEYRWLRRCAPHYVFDFDDAIMFRDSSHRRFTSRRRRRRFRRMVRGARQVIAGNKYLADWAARYTRNVATIPTSIDLAAYPPANARRDGTLTIGWIGTRTNLIYLRAIAPALARVASRHPQVRLKIVADDFIDVPGIAVVKKRWSIADEVEDLRSFHVGIMPLPDDPWTRGKCAVKVLQYFAAGVAVVCSPVGASREIVEDGRNGYFARSEDEWVARLHDLLADEDKRRQLGSAGRTTAAERYSTRANLGRWLAALSTGTGAERAPDLAQVSGAAG